MSYDRLVSQVKSSVGGVEMTLATPYDALLSYTEEKSKYNLKAFQKYLLFFFCILIIFQVIIYDNFFTNKAKSK